MRSTTELIKGRGMSSDRCFEAGPWKISLRKSHILKSSCERGREEGCRDGQDSCFVCKFRRELNSLPALPEMVFPDSWLRLDHESGCGLAFYALDALVGVDSSREPVRVAAATEWSRARADSLAEVKGIVQPYDWTYTTEYRGTLLSGGGGARLKVEESEEGIDYSQLKQQEKIHFYDDVILYEDELADNGTALLNVKIRVMVSGFYILMRFFLRVDGVLVRLNDTRIYHQAGTDYLIREYSSKEATIAELKKLHLAPASILTDSDKLNNILPVKHITVQKLILPQ